MTAPRKSPGAGLPCGMRADSVHSMSGASSGGAFSGHSVTILTALAEARVLLHEGPAAGVQAFLFLLTVRKVQKIQALQQSGLSLWIPLAQFEHSELRESGLAGHSSSQLYKSSAVPVLVRLCTPGAAVLHKTQAVI